MTTKNITIRIDEELRAQLQELVSDLGMDMTTFFTISARQAVREQRIPFAVSRNVPNRLPYGDIFRHDNENVVKP